jgi:hypothetical protein
VSLHDLVTKDRRRAVGALYEHLRHVGIEYESEPLRLDDPDNRLQEIRPPRELLAGPRKGTCLDLVILFAGLCLAVRLAPLLVLLERSDGRSGHALVVVDVVNDPADWGRSPTWQEPFDGVLRNDQGGQVIRQLVEKGHLVAVECTGFARTRALKDHEHEDTVGFESAEKQARGHLKEFRHVATINVSVLHYLDHTRYDAARKTRPARAFVFSGHPYIDAHELGAAFAEKWDRVGEVVLQQDLDKFETWLGSWGLAEEFGYVLAAYRQGQVTVDATVASLVVGLAPELPPRFRGVDISRTALQNIAAAAANGDQEQIKYLEKLLESHALHEYASLDGAHDYGEIEYRWHKGRDFLDEILHILSIRLSLPPDHRVAFTDDVIASMMASMLLSILADNGHPTLTSNAARFTSEDAKAQKWYQWLMEDLESELKSSDPESSDRAVILDWVLIATAPLAERVTRERKAKREQERLKREEQRLQKEEYWRRREQERLREEAESRVEAIRDRIKAVRWFLLPGHAIALVAGASLLILRTVTHHAFNVQASLAHAPHPWRWLVRWWPSPAPLWGPSSVNVSGWPVIESLLILSFLLGLGGAFIFVSEDQLPLFGKYTEAWVWGTAGLGYLIFVSYFPWIGYVLFIVFLVSVLLLLLWVTYRRLFGPYGRFRL